MAIHHHSDIISLEDDAVADGGQQVVEVVLVFVVTRIPAMLLPKFHQGFSKSAMWRNGGEWKGEGENLPKSVSIYWKENVWQAATTSATCMNPHLFRRFSISYRPIWIVWSRRDSPIIRATRAFSSSIYLGTTNKQNHIKYTVQYDTSLLIESTPLLHHSGVRQVKWYYDLKWEAGRQSFANLI